MDLSILAAQLGAQRQLKAGTLRFWGEWFGKPYDNCHRVIGCRSDGRALILDFDGGETLTIQEPQGVRFGPSEFSVSDAGAARWEWFFYGRPQTPENRYFFEFVRKGPHILSSTNVDWYDAKLTPSSDEKAVEIL